MTDEQLGSHHTITDAFDKAGIADAFYCGVDLSGNEISGFCCGHGDKREQSNLMRRDRLLGIIERGKLRFALQIIKIEDIEDAEDLPDNK